MSWLILRALLFNICMLPLTLMMEYCNIQCCKKSYLSKCKDIVLKYDCYNYNYMKSNSVKVLKYLVLNVLEHQKYMYITMSPHDYSPLHFAE